MTTEYLLPKYQILDEIEVPQNVIENWQITLDMLAELIGIPAALIMRVHARDIEVFASSHTIGNVFHIGETAPLNTGLYCETVMSTRSELLVPNSLKDPDWKNNPDIKLGMISYYGLPLIWPNGEIFGTICVLDTKENTSETKTRKLLGHFCDVIQHNLSDIHEITLLNRQKENEKALLRESEMKYRTLFSLSQDALFLIDKANSDILDVNECACTRYGYSYEEMLRLKSTDMSAEPEKTLKAQSTINVEHVIIPVRYHKTKAGEIFPVEISASRLSLHKREVLLISIRDITARLKAEKELRISEERYRLLTHTSMDGFWVVDLSGRILEVNDSYCNMSGFARDALLNMHICDLEQLESKNQIKTRIERIRRKGWDRFESHHRKADGEILVLQHNLTYMPEQEVILAFVSDITERKRIEEQLLQISFRDQLTGLYNRRFYEQELRRLDTARNLPLSFLIGDVNGLKLVNDSFGHTKGDGLLQAVAAVLKKECRADDILARLSGDEFAVLLPKTDSVAAEQLMGRFRKKLSMEHIGLLEISVAFGAATKEVVETPFDSVFKTAEDAMYRSKMYESQSIQNKTISLVMISLLENNYREQLHSQRVSDLCVELARRMGQNEGEVSRIRLAGLMHDIGKIGIREAILNKVGQLTDEERKEMQLHPEIGHRILSTVSDFSEICDCVLQHHEYWDGAGYPKGLRGDEIGLPARMISVVDAFDAMTSERTYRATRSVQEAIDVLRQCSGTQFDPEVVRDFIGVLESRVPDTELHEN